MQGVFTAGDGDLSIVYQAGAHVWGAWNVNYSEGVEPEDFEADRSLGYVGDTGDAGDELAARMWIRSDVSIDQDSQSSTLPAVFREAHERMSGDVVVERTISGPGLGGLVPYVDFHHGDEIGTVIGPKVVPLPVNGIEFSTDPDGGQDYEVHVGKGLLGNRGERDQRNAQLQSQISKEIAERKREIEEQRQRSNQINRGLTGTDHGDILAAVKGSEGALGALNQADVALDEKFTPVQSLVNEQIGVNGAIRNNVTSMNNIINGTSKPVTNGNLWNLNISNWDFQGTFNEAQTAINKWVADSIETLDNRIPVVLSLSKASQAGVGRIYKDGDRYYFQKYFSANCRILWVVALEAFDSYAYTGSAEMTGGANQTAFVNPGLFQTITSITVTVYRQDRMPTISLPSNIDRGIDPRRSWHT